MKEKITVNDLIKKLLEYNRNAEVNAIAHCKLYNFEITIGGAEGVEKHNAETVSFYINELCNNEQGNN